MPHPPLPSSCRHTHYVVNLPPQPSLGRPPLAAHPTHVEYNKRNPSSHATTDVNASYAATLARRDTARKALTARLLGYILVPTIFVISGMVIGRIEEWGEHSQRGGNHRVRAGRVDGNDERYPVRI